MFRPVLRRPEPRAARAVAALACAVAVLAGQPARGDVTAIEITAVYRAADCAEPKCGSGDRALSSGAVVAGTLQIHWRAQSSVGLEYVRLEARAPGSKWFCLQRWEPTGRTSASDSFDWATKTWPAVTSTWRCTEDTDHGHGEDTANGRYTFRVIAKEIAGSEEVSDESFALKLNNAPSAPTWEEGAAADGPRRVKLTWYGAGEPDAAAYTIERTGPGGARSTIAVSAARPEAHGCSKRNATEKIIVISCTDGGFGARDVAGVYRYRIFTHRPAVQGGAACPLQPSTRCLRSTPSEVRRVTVKAGPAASEPAATGARPSVEPSPDATATSVSPPTAAPSPTAGIAFVPQPSPAAGTEKAPESSRWPAVAAAVAALIIAAGAVGRRALASR